MISGPWAAYQAAQAQEMAARQAAAQQIQFAQYARDFEEFPNAVELVKLADGSFGLPLMVR